MGGSRRRAPKGLCQRRQAQSQHHSSSKPAPEPGAGSQFIQDSSWGNQELGGNNMPPLPWTLRSCVNLKLRELFHMSYQKGRIHISLRGSKKQHLAYRNLHLFWLILHILLLKVHPIKYDIFLKHTDRPWSSLAEMSTNLNATNKPEKHIYYTSPKNSTRRHRPTGKILSRYLPSRPRGRTQPDPASLPSTSVRHCHIRAEHALSNVDGTVRDWRSILAQLDLRASPKKRDLKHFPSSPAIYVPQTSKSKANHEAGR